MVRYCYPSHLGFNVLKFILEFYTEKFNLYITKHYLANYVLGLLLRISLK